MLNCSVGAVLLDIEGTTSSISFVYEVMFPFARRELDPYLRRNWGEPELQAACQRLASDAGQASFDDWCAASLGPEAGAAESCRRLVRDEVTRLMDADVKSTGLKQLQGLIWRAGFQDGELRAHLYDDVLPAVRRWSERACDVRVYSSGSIAAQRLFFEHTIHGNLLPYFRGHYDTTTGPKQEVESYRKIAVDFDRPPGQILFISDVVAELNAARGAGLQTVLSVRPGNPPVASTASHPVVTAFDQIQITQ